MLPAHLAENIRRQVLYYLQSTFNFRDAETVQAFEQFLLDGDRGIFKGPWVQLNRPFRPADQTYQHPFQIHIPFHPFKHQSRSWRRLHCRNQQPQPTLVTTGTGSGKTECFLYPVLDHCLQAKQAGKPGIKAIILYPMNALATDQEKRFANAIWNDPALKTAGIRVGNYTGRYDPADQTAFSSGDTQMGEDHGITNHEAQLDAPPDILLTNYKMLDFLLLRPQDQKLWRFNEPGTLTYLILDELHTYDGAQGADVACLIRRLKERLKIPKGQLCVVGTSATMDDRDRSDRAMGNIILDKTETGRDRLAQFASKLFEEDIPPTRDAIIGEDRLKVEEIVIDFDSDLLEPELPNPQDCQPTGNEDSVSYANRQAHLWAAPTLAMVTHEEGPSIATDTSTEINDPAKVQLEQYQPEQIEAWNIALGNWLKKTKFFKQLLTIFDANDRSNSEPLTWSHIIDKMAVEEWGFFLITQFGDRRWILISFFALIAHAKEVRSGRAFPLVPTQVQLWIRELTRIGRYVQPDPSFGWLDEPDAENRTILPAFQCSECGVSGWLGLKDPKYDSAIGARGVQGFRLSTDINAIYQGWFRSSSGVKDSHDPKIVVIVPDLKGNMAQLHQGDSRQGNVFGDYYFHPRSLVIRQGAGPCPFNNDSQGFQVSINDDVEQDHQKKKWLGKQGCPCCHTKDSIFIIGSRSATLSSVMVDELFGSILNTDPKLLAFTDSVQDASHRAGFLSARTYNFSFRTALQHIVDAAGADGVPLHDVGAQLLDWWSIHDVGRPGTLKSALSALLPPDLADYQEYVEYRNSAQTEPSLSLRNAIETRLTWQATQEFGLNVLRGRTMESSGSACLAWDWSRINATVTAVRAEIESVDTSLADVSIAILCRWLLGILHRYRLRGAISHPYLVDYARYSYWGKSPFGRFIPDREVHPPLSRYRPRLMVTKGDRHHDYILSQTSGRSQPWHIRWTLRVLNRPTLSEVEALDLLNLLYRKAEDTGLLKRLHIDGAKVYYAINAEAARLVSNGVQLTCTETHRRMVRPQEEAILWEHAPSLDYNAAKGEYAVVNFDQRQRYYQDRYRKGALRRVVANEHTGLLTTEERESVEASFSQNRHADDPNVLTCTSTLEMGIDIGDLSSTMLCSVPPTTASYLQRIGRAGRSTGTALIVSVINHQPHDLFFFGRPQEMLRGKVDPPGCWVDASAVLVRQYLAYCFDSATASGQLLELPRSGVQFVEDLGKEDGHLPAMMAWVAQNEAFLQQAFLARFAPEIIQADTRTRFIEETETEKLLQRVRQVAQEFARQRRDLKNAQTRLRKQKAKLDENETEALADIEAELKVLKGRQASLTRTTALELLTNYGLLPNYSFPETGVRFYGSVYNRHRKMETPIPPIEVIRPAASALRELAPHNHFYTHKRQFDIQQIAIGNRQEPLTETWAICGRCGHMRPLEDLNQDSASPACPQCHYDGGADSQTDIGQHKQFIDYSRSQAISVMEHYESLSSDRSDERQNQFYQRRYSFDLTIDSPNGATGDESLPFGIEYRTAVILRDVNVGYQGDKGIVAFGPEGAAPEHGFQVCQDCGVVAHASQSMDEVAHRRSCSARRRFEKAKAENRSINPYKAESVYIYREIRSEAIRVLVPPLSEDEIQTLRACLLLGLRLRFEGDPSHLSIFPQKLPDGEKNLLRDYLIILDRVPGGTGYLKALFQETDSSDRTGEGIMAVMRAALDALESCHCARLSVSEDADTDGCYRCIRTYSQRYNAASVSRTLGISLLKRLIESGNQRIQRHELTDIPDSSLFGSMLERQLVNRLESWVMDQAGSWERTLIEGKAGFRFRLGQPARTWDLELQPQLGPAQGVMHPCQPDFMLRCPDDETIRPVAIFTDGYEFHVTINRLADDMAKRRAILNSGRYYVWSLTWDDLQPTGVQDIRIVSDQIAAKAEQFANEAYGKGMAIPSCHRVFSNAWQQFLEFIHTPQREDPITNKPTRESPQTYGWQVLAEYTASYPLELLATHHRTHDQQPLFDALDQWRTGQSFQPPPSIQDGTWVCNHKATSGEDLLTVSTHQDCLENRRHQVRVSARLGDSEAERLSPNSYRPRWRHFLACLNFFQFCGAFSFCTTSEVTEGLAPDVIPEPDLSVASGEWEEIRAEVIPSFQPLVDFLAAKAVSLPCVAYEDETIAEEAIAELAWADHSPPVAVLAGEQTMFAVQWQEAGWTIFTEEMLQAQGKAVLIDLLRT